jgi:hypothetical protein
MSVQTIIQALNVSSMTVPPPMSKRTGAENPAAPVHPGPKAEADAEKSDESVGHG